MAQFGNSMRVKYIPVGFSGDEVQLAIEKPRGMFPSRIGVIDPDMSDEYYLELNFKKVTPKDTRGMLLDITDVALYNRAGDVMEYYYWNPNASKGVWHRE